MSLFGRFRQIILQKSLQKREKSRIPFQRLSEKFPTFVIRKNIEIELGYRLSDMGYTRHKANNGSTCYIAEQP